jgi:predicted lysophospholipase L1 biosynthesis ABC-type transport system permease subunit
VLEQARASWTAALAVEYVSLFTLLPGVAVLLAAMQATREERRFEVALLRTLGASRRRVLAAVVVKFLVVLNLVGNPIAPQPCAKRIPSSAPKGRTAADPLPRFPTRLHCF